MQNFTTADIHDADPAGASVCESQFRSFGRLAAFSGPCVTVRVYEDHRQVKELLATPGQGRVLVIDGAASARIGLMGDSMAQAGAQNGWAGAIVYGAIRDSLAIDQLEFGVKALFTTSRRASVPAQWQRDLPVTFGNVTFNCGDWVYADVDSVLIRKEPLA
jgi:regulator of ribonuclease activity A